MTETVSGACFNFCEHTYIKTMKGKCMCQLVRALRVVRGAADKRHPPTCDLGILIIIVIFFSELIMATVVACTAA